MIKMHTVRKVDGGGFIALMPRPGGDDILQEDMAELKKKGVDVLVSLLEAHEDKALGLTTERQYAVCQQIEFVSHPVPDKGVPQDSIAFVELITDLTGRVLAGTGVTVHCWGGIGRSGLFSAGVLIALGATTGEALRQVSAARGVQVPETPDQIIWLVQHQDRLRAGVKSNAVETLSKS